MIILVKHIFFYTVFFLSFSIPSFTDTLSWNYNRTPSLVLTEKIGVIESNGSLMIDPESAADSNSLHFIRIEDMVAPYDTDFEEIFVRFSKKHFSSHVIVKMYDTFTDQLLTEIQFDENKIIPLGKTGSLSDRIYLTVEIIGDDVELRAAGVSIIKALIVDEEGFTLNKDKMYVNKDTLFIQLHLNEEAKVSLFVYDNLGDINERIVKEQVLDRGTYSFYWHPITTKGKEITEGTLYYVWLEAENIRSYPIEYVREVFVIP